MSPIGGVIAGAVLLASACSGDGATTTVSTAPAAATTAPIAATTSVTTQAGATDHTVSVAGIDLEQVTNIHTDIPAEVFYVIPVLAAPAEAVNAPLRQLLESREETFVADVIEFLPKKNEDTEEPMSYLDISTEVLVANESLVSTRFFESSYFQGAANPAQAVQVVNLDPGTGAEYELFDVFLGEEFAFALDTLARQNIVDRIYQGNTSGLEAWAPAESVIEFEHLVLSPVAIEITFDELEVGPAVLGTPTAFIPYRSVGVYLDLDGPVGSLLEADGTPRACSALAGFQESVSELLAFDPGSGEIDALERIAVRGTELVAAAPETAEAVEVLTAWSAEYMDGIPEPSGGTQGVEAANDIIFFLADRGDC